jgi:ribosome-associated toxin RatA of RatAB toxin-antitoxin module
MAILSVSIQIHAPVETVFGWVDAPDHYPRFWPNMQEVTHLARGASGGYDFDFVYRMSGLTLRGHNTTTVFEPPSHILAVQEGMVNSSFEWWFSDEGGATRLDLSIDYDLPDNVLGHLAWNVLESANRKDAETMLANLKALIEGG